MRKRQENDYADFQVFVEEDVLPLIDETEEFISKVIDLIENKLGS